MADIAFYTNPMSRGQIARWALHEAGADYDQHLLSYESDMKGDAYLAINPMGKVPAIVHHGKIVTECAAICAYLAEAFPDADLLPYENERADYFRWLFFTAGPAEQAITSNSMQWVPTDEQQRMVGFGSYDRVVDVLEDALTQTDFICGPRFTAADIYVGSQVDWGVTFGSLPTRPVFTAYAERVRARPAYQAAKAIDNALIAKMQAAPAA